MKARLESASLNAANWPSLCLLGALLWTISCTVIAADHGVKVTGEQIFSRNCSACHRFGMMRAPKIGDQAQWNKRLHSDGGVPGLLAVALSGRGEMPPRGGNPGLSKDELRSAIEYMLRRSKADISDGAPTHP